MKTLGLVPARSGSKGIVGKNLRPFGGVPLMYRALAIGRATCDHAVISTDAPEAHGSLILNRPSDLAQDDTPMLPVVQHAVAHFAAYHDAPDIVVLLQPTQPLRTTLHVLEALRLLEETGADSVASVVEIPAHYSPDYACQIESAPELGHCVLWPYLAPDWDRAPKRRQGTRRAYSRDGTVYAIKRQTIEAGSLYGSHCVPLVIPSHESVNLDSEEDWTRAESMVKR